MIEQMQKHITALQAERDFKDALYVENRLRLLHMIDTRNQVIYFLVATVIVGAIVLGNLANDLGKSRSEAKIWKEKALSEMNENIKNYAEYQYAKAGVNEAIHSGFIQKMPPPIVSK